MKPGTILQIVVSVVLLAVLLRWIEGPAFNQAIAGADLPLMGFAFVLALADRVLMALKWNLLLRAKSIHLSWNESIRVYWRSTFLGAFLPATIGGDVARVIIMSKSESRRTDVVSSIFVERLLGFVSLAVFGVVAGTLAPAILRGGPVNRGELLAVSAGAVVVAAALLAFSFTRPCERIVESIAARTHGVRFLGQAVQWLLSVYHSFRAYRRHPRTLGMFLLLSLAENLLPIARAFCVAEAMHVHVGVLFFVVIVPLELFVSRLPITIDGLGLREGVFMWYLMKVGIPESQGFAVGLMNHVLFLLSVMPGGVFHFLAVRRSTKERTCAESQDSST